MKGIAGKVTSGLPTQAKLDCINIVFFVSFSINPLIPSRVGSDELVICKVREIQGMLIIFII